MQNSCKVEGGCIAKACAEDVLVRDVRRVGKNQYIVMCDDASGHTGEHLGSASSRCVCPMHVCDEIWKTRSVAAFCTGESSWSVARRVPMYCGKIWRKVE